MRGAEVERPAETADTTRVLRAATFWGRFVLRADEDFGCACDPFRDANFPAFVFKLIDLTGAGDRFAAFLTAFAFCFAFVAMSLPNCKVDNPQKSRRWICSGSIVAALHEGALGHPTGRRRS